MLRLRTLGGLGLVSDTRTLAGAATQRRPLALLAVLAVAGDRGVSRERLLALIWPETDEVRARRVLAQTVYALRRDLGDPGFVLGTADLRVNRTLLSADVTEFQCAVGKGELECAAALYQGPFLDGVNPVQAPEFEQWASIERARLDAVARRALERLAREAIARADSEVAIGWWRRLDTLDPLSARVAVGLMEALVASGDTAGALRHARVHEALLRAELGAPPDPAVKALADRLRTPDRRFYTAATSAPSQTRSAALPAVPIGSTSVRSGRPPADAEIETCAAATGSGPHVGFLLPDAATPVVALRHPLGAASAEPRMPGAATPPGAAGRWRHVPGRRRTLVAVGVAGMLVGAIGAGAVLVPGARGITNALEPRVVVVAPFDVADPELRLWGEGIVDVLSRHLDSAGAIRTIPPTRVAHEWKGRADRETVLRFARALGAGTAVYGILVRTGTDSLRASVTVLHASTGQALLETSRKEPIVRMDRLTDSIAVDVLRAMDRVRGVGAVRASTIAPWRVHRGTSRVRAWGGVQPAPPAGLRCNSLHHAVAFDSTLAWRRVGAVAPCQRLVAGLVGRSIYSLPGTGATAPRQPP